MGLLDISFKFLGCEHNNAPNKLREKAKVGGEKKTTGWRIIPKTGWWTDALRLTRGRSIRSAMVGFDSQTRRASHQMQTHTLTLPLSIHPSLQLSFLFCILSQILFSTQPLEGLCSHIYPSREAAMGQKKNWLKDTEPWEELYKDETTEPRQRKKGEYSRLCSDDHKQQTVMKSRCQMLKGVRYI